MRLPRLYPILDTETLANAGVGVEVAAAAFLEGGASILQFRHKGHWSREIFASAKQIAGTTIRYRWTATAGYSARLYDFSWLAVTEQAS